MRSTANNIKPHLFLRLPAISFLCLLFTISLIAPQLAAEQTFGASEEQGDFTFSAQATDEFLNVEDAYSLDVDFQASKQGSDTQPVLIWGAKPGYYLYKHGFKQFSKNEKEASEQPLDGVIPTGKLTVDEYFGEVETYYNQVVIPLDTTNTQEPFFIRAQSQGCADAGLCYPPHDVYAKVDLKTQTAEQLTQSEYLAQTQPPKATSPTTALQTTFFIALISAFFGGLILNLMPCVLPVLSIKLLQIQQAGSHIKLHGMAYMAGVMSSFLAMAGVLIALKNAGHAVGWGFQLQHPWVIALLIFLFFTLALSLSGFFELGGRLMGLGQGISQPANSKAKNKLGSAFSTGILAVIVATPCTAPFMGTALGFALTQSSTSALLIFASLGFGMALPLTAITFIPRLHDFMPKPGMWMVRLKEFFAFPLYLTCVWLLWVLANQTSTTSLAFVLLGLIGICFAIWCFKSQAVVLKILGVASLLGVLSLFTSNVFNTQANNATSKHLAYSSEALSSLRAQGVPVFIDLTADWCITCLANERSTLDTPIIQQAFKDAGITYMVGDWTNFNPEITELLERHQRSGIPLYLLYPASANEPATILPQILSKNIVLDAIRNN